MKFVCIICPNGCEMTCENGLVTGNLCKRGEEYAKREATAPMRDVTSTLPVSDRGTSVSVKTASPIPKARIREMMEFIRTHTVSAPIRRGDVLFRNVCGTNLIATMTVL